MGGEGEMKGDGMMKDGAMMKDDAMMKDGEKMKADERHANCRCSHFFDGSTDSSLTPWNRRLLRINQVEGESPHTAPFHPFFAPHPKIFRKMQLVRLV